MVLHALFIAIQSSIDIANHLISERCLRKPANYKEAFKILGEAGLISDYLAEKLSDLVGFRNVLVHIYWGLDIDLVCGILQGDRGYLKAFSDEAKKILRESRKEEK